MKKYIKAMTIRDMRIDAVSRTVYSFKTAYSVTYVNPDGYGGADREYTEKDVPKRVLNFIENESVNTCHTEGRQGWRGSYVYDVFWRKGTPEAEMGKTIDKVE